ncbi:hypothetical protein CHARACLAT_028860, partial [Characodon lateralis]|nr:hypothetical protein [Characodon lateralis]
SYTSSGSSASSTTRCSTGCVSCYLLRAIHTGSSTILRTRSCPSPLFNTTFGSAIRSGIRHELLSPEPLIATAIWPTAAGCLLPTTDLPKRFGYPQKDIPLKTDFHSVQVPAVTLDHPDLIVARLTKGI